MTDRSRLTERIALAARAEGFDRCAVARVVRIGARAKLREWLAAGLHAEMGWLGTDPDRRADPAAVLPGARSVLALARDYYSDSPVADDPRHGRISRYAWGEEYHRIMGAGVRRLYDRIQRLAPGVAGRYYVDTGPVMEKAWAQAGGMGWIGKHTNLITAAHGSWFFLAVILLDIDLEPGIPARDHCGTCTACIDVCPTRAIIRPYVLDAGRCIAYQTIENRGPIPVCMRGLIGNRIFGCDDCQEICPWNRFATRSTSATPFAPRPENRAPALENLLELDEEGFRERFRNSPVRRAKWAGLLRNVAVALGNSRNRRAAGGVARRLRSGPALARGHCAWALGRIGGRHAWTALRAAASAETDPWVREEIELAMQELEEDARRGNPEESDSTP